MLNEIKWAWQRITRGYDERITWGFDVYFIQIIPALKEFCENWLQLGYADHNPEKKEVMLETLRLIQDYQTATVFNEGEFTYHSWIDQDQKLAILAAYFGENINAYWD